MPPFAIARLVGCLYAVYCFRRVGCKGPAGSDDAIHMLKLWVAASNMRQGKDGIATGSMVALQSDCSGWMACLAGAVLLGAEEAHRQGACSSQSCGESPCALGQRVPLGDQQAWVQELTAKLFAEVWFLSTGHLQQQSYAVERLL